MTRNKTTDQIKVFTFGGADSTDFGEIFDLTDKDDGGTQIGLLLPAVQKVREAASKSDSVHTYEFTAFTEEDLLDMEKPLEVAIWSGEDVNRDGQVDATDLDFLIARADAILVTDGAMDLLAHELTHVVQQDDGV